MLTLLVDAKMGDILIELGGPTAPELVHVTEPAVVVRIFGASKYMGVS